MSTADNRIPSLRRDLLIEVSPRISHGGNLGNLILWSHAQIHANSQTANSREEILGNEKGVLVRVSVKPYYEQSFVMVKVFC